jgi:hypothetical protein
MTQTKKKILIVGAGAAGSGVPHTGGQDGRSKGRCPDCLAAPGGLFPEVAAERIDSGTDVEGTIALIASRRDAGAQVVLLATGDRESRASPNR